jgi:hypothetical protein
VKAICWSLQLEQPVLELALVQAQQQPALAQGQELALVQAQEMVQEPVQQQPALVQEQHPPPQQRQSLFQQARCRLRQPEFR